MMGKEENVLFLPPSRQQQKIGLGMTKIPVAILWIDDDDDSSVSFSLLWKCREGRKRAARSSWRNNLVQYELVLFLSVFLLLLADCWWRPGRKQKQTLERISDCVEFKRPLSQMFIRLSPSRYSCEKDRAWSIHQQVRHPPAFVKAKKKKKKKKIWERKSSENKKTKGISRWDDAPLGWWGSLIATHTHNPSMAHLLLLLKKKKIYIYFGTTIHQHPLLPTLRTRNIFRWSSRKKMTEQVSLSLLIFIFFRQFFFLFRWTFSYAVV